jgi:UDPglucose--hexose-1-phosphate uridylyltransferase
MSGELRKDPATGKWVLARPRRARDGRGGETGSCPFCPGNEHLTPPEIVAYRSRGLAANGEGWQVRVFPDQDPYFTIEEDLVREGVGMFDRVSARGASEIIVDFPDHDTTFADASDEQLQRLLWMYRERIQDLKRDPKIRNVLVFRQQGHPGARIRHPYSRILATPIVFDDVRMELAQAREYFEYKRRCVYCDTAREELVTGERLVELTPHFVAFVPYAARVSFEVRVLPRRHACAYEEISAEEIADLARLLRGLDGLVQRALGAAPWEMVLHTAPNLRVKIVQGEWSTVERDYHWHLELLPNPAERTSVAGIAVTDLLPEQAAAALRAAAALAEPAGGR